MPHDLSGKRALVTAAGQGIGRAIAVALAEAGAEVIATDINREQLADLSAKHSLRTAYLNVLDDTDVETVTKGEGPFDILCNCAGFVHDGTILDASMEQFDFATELNIKAMMRMIRAVLPAMREIGDGAIINISSVASSIKGIPSRFVYGTTKAGVIGLTKSVAADFITDGIRCNAICPGTVESPSLQDRIKAGGDYEETRKAFVARQPMGRIGTAEEIADLAVHLAAATYTTGQAYAIDGGWSL